MFKANRNTLLKRKPIDSSLLSPSEIIEVKEGEEIKGKFLKTEGNHTLIQLDTPIKGFFNWYIFTPHFSSSEIDWNNPASKISKYFTVGEVTNNDSRRIPKEQNIINNVLKIAKELDKIREAWGSSIEVTSWYRPPVINASIGGARGSQHLNGGAADIYPLNGKGREFEQWLDRNWFGALGWGQTSGRGFTHIDIRNNQGFKTGGSKGPRWYY